MSVPAGHGSDYFQRICEARMGGAHIAGTQERTCPSFECEQKTIGDFTGEIAIAYLFDP